MDDGRCAGVPGSILSVLSAPFSLNHDHSRLRVSYAVHGTR